MGWLIDIASAIVGEITKYAIAPVGRQLGYLIHYQNNINKLRDKIKKLEGKRESINLQIEEGRRRGEKTHKDVDNWLKKEETSSKEAEELLNDKGHAKAECSCTGSFPNLVLRHQLSRKLKKMADTIEARIGEVDSFQNDITFRPALIESSFENEDFEVFATRTPCLVAIMEALQDPNCSKIGVCGFGVVGKTTLVQEVARRAQEKIFSVVVMVTVSQTFDPRKIQKEIAEKLGLTLDEESMSARANRLQDRLKGEEKILMIFDDIWERLELKDIGIEFKGDNQKGCKILLVSRGQHVLLNDMRVEKHFEVGVLSGEESMKLFKKFVGQEHSFEGLAADIVDQCGGLPIAILPIATRLRNRERFVWDRVLNKLRRCSKEGYEEPAYPSVKTSYEFLNGKQEQQILLLCSLYKEDTNINVENLMSIYGAYSDMFLDEDTLEDARSSLLTSVDELKRCYLLLSGDEDGTVKLHDVIRKIMASIALEELSMRCFECFEKLERDSNRGNLNDSTAISLIDHDIKQLPENLACPRLKLLLMQEESYRSSDSPAVLFSKQFFEAAEELRALCLHSLTVKPLPLLSSSLRKLQTLSLQNCVIEDIGFIGELDSLLVLDLSNSEFKELPEQIGKLTCLRQLNLNNCVHLKVIRPNVISCLSKLEELYMDGVRVKWRKETVDGESMNASLDELKMSQLRALHLCIEDANVLPKGMFVDAKLNRFNIKVKCKTDHPPPTRLRLLLQSREWEKRMRLLLKSRERGHTKLLQVQLSEQSQLHEYGFQMLMKECEVLYLGTPPGVNNIICQLDADGFPQLKILYIHENDEVQHIVKSTGEIQPLINEKVVFKSLQVLSVVNCKSLLCLRDLATFESLQQLRKLEVWGCELMEEVLVVTKEAGDQDRNMKKISFPKLIALELRCLPKLKRFCQGDCTIEFPSLLELKILDCPELKAFIAKSTTSATIIEKDVEEREVAEEILFSRKVVFKALETLKIKRCNNLLSLWELAASENIQHLERLQIYECERMEEILVIAKEAGDQERKLKKISFPKLEELKLDHLPKLKSFCQGDCTIEFLSNLGLEFKIVLF